jgi:chaperone required for assembly of F1-ATPase
MKRFYKTVENGADGTILLDGRPVRTPARAQLALPGKALAAAVADEWRAQGEDIDPRAMPLTGLANAALDRVKPDPAGFAAGLAAYGESDLLCYRAEEPEPLVARQNQRWDPILEWAEDRFDLRFTLVAGVMHRPQSAETVARLGAAIAAQPPFRLAALSPIITISGSLVIALALADGALEPGAAFDLAHLDELWQEEMWGADWFATEARNVRRADFDAACRFLALLDG